MARALEIPASIDHIDPAWLTRALRAAGALACGAVTSLRRGARAGGTAVTSRVERLLLDLDPPDAHGPRSVIVKLPSPAWTHGPYLYEREVMFYRRLAAAHALPAPRCYHADYDGATGAFVLVLEDLSGAVPGHRLDGLRAAEAERALDVIGGMHAGWWGSPLLDGWPVKSYDRAHADRNLAAFGDGWPRLRALGRYPVSADVARAADAAVGTYTDDLLRLSAGPRTLIHSDLHAENLIVDTARGVARVVAIDWQNAALGHCAFDVANLVCATHPDAVRSRRGALLDGYHARLVSSGVVEYARDQLAADVAAAVRWLFVSGAPWLATSEAETVRDAATLDAQWTRLCAAMTAM